MRIRQFCVALIAAATLAACGDDDGTNVNASVAGTYPLRTVNGAPLPYLLVQDGADRVDLLSGVIILRSDRTFTDSTTYRVVEGGVTFTDAEVARGTYTRTGDELAFTASDGFRYYATLSGSTITQSLESYTFVYRR